MVSLEELMQRYDKFRNNPESILAHWKDYSFGKNNFDELPPNNISEGNYHSDHQNTESNFKDNQIKDHTALTNHADIFNNGTAVEAKRPSRIIGGSFSRNYNYSRVSKPSFLPVNIAAPVNIGDSTDWIRLREEALDLHELTTFFAGKQDSQSEKFRTLIAKYKESVGKALALPEEIEADSSNKFVAILIDVLEKRFYTILKSCINGKKGKGEQPASYYYGIEERVKKYFDRIGLKSENVQVRTDYRQCQDYMKAEEEPTNFEHDDYKIMEIDIQPYYFEYYTDDGTLEKSYIDGLCTIYRSNRR